ncbi:hypothetical protein [Nonomuraea sp. NPDC049158]|uniref:hypothetical protein n=1 Tax=Nonomuraea sp. NPDC049158 TaxID=3155649 RepID=UPI0033E36B61
MRPLFFPDNPQFWYETLPTFGHIAYGGADFGEVAITCGAQRLAFARVYDWLDDVLSPTD